MQPEETPRLFPLGDSAVVVEFGAELSEQTQRRVWALGRTLDRSPIKGMVDYITSFTSVTVFYDAAKVYYTDICKEMEAVLTHPSPTSTDNSRLIEIPICYGDEFGPDLAYVAKHNSLTPQDVCKIHSNGDYIVAMIGFSPGFPFLSGMSDKIATPRREVPRIKVPKGSVGIAGAQTGIYSFETPGGWQLIGRTPITLFLPNRDPPCFLQTGDTVRFVPISASEFSQWRG